jgi:uncharacterized membrane protein YoaK (UPF0700 family)
MYLRYSPLCSASSRRRASENTPDKAPEISVATEIVFLFVIAILHNRLPQVAGTLGLSFVAAFQTASFPRVEGWGYSSVMATSNFRYTIEGLFAAFAGSSEARPFRRPYVFGAMCIGFGAGAAIGAVVTEVTRAYSLAIPVILLAVVLLLCNLTDGKKLQPSRLLGT